jgi:hypothetical protein
MSEACSTYGIDKEKYSILIGKPEGKRPRGRRKCRWEIILERILGKYIGKVWSGCIWIRIGTSGGLL